MKSKIVKSKKEVKELPFPKLMKCQKEHLRGTTRELVVLFISEDTGLVVHGKTKNTSSDFTGEFSSDWSIGKFKPFNGTIKLSN